MKKFLLPFQNMVRADLFSGSLAVWNALGFAFHGVYPVARRRRWFGTRPPIPSPAKRDEDRIPFELFQEYTANWNFARKTAPPRGAELAARLEFERVFLAKRKRIYQ